MARTRNPRTIAAFGLRQLAGGFRRSSPASASLGMAALLYAVGVWRRRPKEELVYSRRLRDGDALEIRMIRGIAEIASDDGSSRSA